MNKITVLVLAIFSLFAEHANAQVSTSALGTGDLMELEAIQTPLGTFVAASMEDFNPPVFGRRIFIHRSTDMGTSWNLAHTIDTDSVYIDSGDPVLSIDVSGNIYMITMRRPGLVNYNYHLSLYISSDDGLTWNHAGYPYDGSEFADFPQLISSGNGELYLSYTLLSLIDSLPAKIHFIKSANGGFNWTNPIEFDASVPALKSVLGADLSWSANNQLCLTYGDNDYSKLYFTSSSDSGSTWQNVNIINNVTKNSTNKLISNTNFNHLGIVSHRPHITQTDIYYSYSLDNGGQWQSSIIADSSAYCEGVIDSTGNVHLIYNQLKQSVFSLMYTYSTDRGQTFSAPYTLYSAPFVKAAIGEYQSLILASDGLFHLTFVDWSDNSDAKQLVFAPLLTSLDLKLSKYDIPIVYPNPVKGKMYVEVSGLQDAGYYELVNLSGIVLKKGQLLKERAGMDLSELVPGAYLLRIVNGRRIFIRKIIKA